MKGASARFLEQSREQLGNDQVGHKSVVKTFILLLIMYTNGLFSFFFLIMDFRCIGNMDWIEEKVLWID